MSRRIALFTVVVLLALLVGATRPASAQIFSGPKITRLDPSQVVPGISNQSVKMVGTGFASGATITLNPDTGITFTSSFVSSTEIDLSVTVASSAPTTPRDVTITQGLFGSTDTCTRCMTVGPDITSVTGPLANSGATGTFTITGHAFVTGSTVRISRSGYGYNAAETDTVTASSVTVNGPTSITATVATANKAPGRWKVTVQKDTGTATFGDGVTTGLEITGNKPSVTSLNPQHIKAGETNKSIIVAGTNFAKGMTVTVSGTGVTQSAPTDVSGPTSATLHLTAASNAASGVRDLVLVNADSQFSSKAPFGVGVDPPAQPVPTVTSVSPATVGQGASKLTMIVTGTNFGSTPAVTVQPATGITVDSVTRDSATQLTLAVSTAIDATTGAHDLTVSNGNNTATKTNAFTIDTTFAVTGLTPPGRPRGYTGTVVVNGAGFSGTPTVSIAATGGDVTTGTVVRDSAAQLTVPVTVSATATLSSRNVTVTNNGTPIICNACFTVSQAPTVTSITPTGGNGGAPVSITHVSGAFFSTPTLPTVTLERADQPKIAMTETTGSTTDLQGTLDLTNAAPGTWNVRVTNADGGTAVLANAFTVVFGAPSFPTSPAEDLGSIPQNTPSTVLHVTGSNFAPGMVVTILNSAGVSVTDTTRKSPTAADVTIATADNAALGSRDLKVTNTDGKSAVCDACFAVTQGNQKQFFGSGFTAYDNFNGGTFVAGGHLGGPSVPIQVVTGANAGGGPHVRVFAITPSTASASAVTGFMAYDPAFAGGVHVATGDVDGDGVDEIITGPGPGGGPHVRVFHVNNDTSVTTPFGGGFMAYDTSFTGGVWVAAGDVNGDGKADIITGAGAGGGPHVRVFTLAADGHSFQPIGGFMAYAPEFKGGVAVSAGNLIPEASEAPVVDEIAVVPSQGGGPHVRIMTKDGGLLDQFMAFSTGDSNGYRITSGDFDFDTTDDLAVARGSTPGILVAHLTDAAPGYEALTAPNPEPLGGGTNVAAADVDNDGDADLIVAPDNNSPSTVRLMRPLSHTT